MSTNQINPPSGVLNSQLAASSNPVISINNSIEQQQANNVAPSKLSNNQSAVTSHVTSSTSVLSPNATSTNSQSSSNKIFGAEVLQIFGEDSQQKERLSPGDSDFELNESERKNAIINSRLKDLSLKNQKKKAADQKQQNIESKSKLNDSASKNSFLQTAVKKIIPSGFDLSGFKKATNMKKDEEINAEEAVDLEKYKNLLATLDSSDIVDTYRYYQNFQKAIPSHLHLIPIADVLNTPCCSNLCNFKFDHEVVMKSRLTIPVIATTKNDTAYNVIQQFHFHLIKNFYVNGQFLPKLNNFPICSEFFSRVYIINHHRFKVLCDEILKGNVQPTPHGHAGLGSEHFTTLDRYAKLLFTLNKVVEPHPSGTGLMGPSGWTKKEVIDRAGFGTTIQINPTQEIKRLNVPISFEKANDLTKCDKCIIFRQIKNNPKASPEERREAEMHLKNHHKNVTNDRRNGASTQHFSTESDGVIAVSHDGMSKNKTKVPHLLENNTKKLAEKYLLMCSLNLAVVHKKKDDLNYQNKLFWNIAQLSGNDSNVIASQLFHAISTCDKIPSKIAIQLDNCQSNKSYTLLGAFGLLLVWSPKVTKIYITMSEVGHTHNEVDQKFGVLAKALDHKEVYSPQEMAKFAEENLRGVVSNNLFPTTYDFETIVKGIHDPCGKIKANHSFQLSKDDKDNVILRIARFMRSETFLMNDPKYKEPDAFHLFKNKPEANKFPTIVPLKELDMENHNKLCKALKGRIPAESYKELLDLPDFIKNRPAAEPFEILLKRINDKVIPPTPMEEISDDVENEAMERFLKSGIVARLWPDGTPEHAEDEDGQDSVTTPSLPKKSLQHKGKVKPTTVAKRPKLDDQPTSSTAPKKPPPKPKVVNKKESPKALKRRQPSK